MHDQIAQLERENFRLRILLAGQRDPNVFVIAQTVFGGNSPRKNSLDRPRFVRTAKSQSARKGPRPARTTCTAPLFHGLIRIQDD